MRALPLVLALTASLAWAALSAPGAAVPAPYEVIGVTRNDSAVIVVAYAPSGVGRAGVSVLVNRDVQSGRTRWKRYLSGKVTVGSLKTNGERLYAWAAIPGGHWEYVFHLATGEVLNQIEVRHVTPDSSAP